MSNYYEVEHVKGIISLDFGVGRPMRETIEVLVKFKNDPEYYPSGFNMPPRELWQNYNILDGYFEMTLSNGQIIKVPTNSIDWCQTSITQRDYNDTTEVEKLCLY